MFPLAYDGWDMRLRFPRWFISSKVYKGDTSIGQIEDVLVTSTTGPFRRLSFHSEVSRVCPFRLH